MYNYETEKTNIFTIKGMKEFIKVRDKVLALIDETGAITMGHAIQVGNTGVNSWFRMAIIDHMVELGDLREVNQYLCPAQYRVFVRG